MSGSFAGCSNGNDWAVGSVLIDETGLCRGVDVVDVEGG